MSPVDVDRFTILGHIRTSGIVVTRDLALRSTRYTEGPDLTLSIVRLVRTEGRGTDDRRGHCECFAESSLGQTCNTSRTKKSFVSLS